MKQVASCLFDLELEHEPAPALAGDVGQAIAQAVRALALEARAATAEVASLADAVGTGQADLVRALQAAGYDVRLRETVGGGTGSACLRNLRHSFLLASPHGGQSPRDVIVDATFREQFVIAHASPRYAAVLDALPAVFIGPAAAVRPLVELLCGEMALAFAAAGIVLPPWRSLRSMLSKWLPRRSMDMVLPLGGASGAAAAPPPQHQQQQRQPGGGRLLRCGGGSGTGSCGASLSGCLTGSSSSSGGASSTGGEHAPHGRAHAGGGSSGSCAGSSPYAGALAGAAVRKAAPGGGRQGSGASAAQADRTLRSTARRTPVLEPLQRVVGGFGLSCTPRHEYLSAGLGLGA